MDDVIIHRELGGAGPVVAAFVGVGVGVGRIYWIFNFNLKRLHFGVTTIDVIFEQVPMRVRLRNVVINFDGR